MLFLHKTTLINPPFKYLQIGILHLHNYSITKYKQYKKRVLLEIKLFKNNFTKRIHIPLTSFIKYSFAASKSKNPTLAVLSKLY